MSAREGRTRPGARTGRLLEREWELETLAAAVAAAADGTAGLVLIEGPAGIGKSRLLAEARRWRRSRSCACARRAAGEMERDFPFGVVRQLFESHVLVEESERSRLLSGAAAAAAPVFGPRRGAWRAEPPDEGTFAMLHGLFWLTVNLCSERALLLAVDDLALVRQRLGCGSSPIWRGGWMTFPWCSWAACGLRSLRPIRLPWKS